MYWGDNMSIKNLNVRNLLKEMDEYKLIDNICNKDYYLKDVASQYDENGFIPQEIGKTVQELFADDNYVIGIHRVKEADVDDIFEKGIINNFDLNDDLSGPSIETTVDFYKDHINLLGEVKQSSLFDSDGAVIVKIPRYYMKNYTAYDVEKPIFYKDIEKNCRLLPEYVYGYACVDSLSNIVGFVENEKYSDEHTYSNEGLICDTMKENNISKTRRLI